MGNGQSQSSNSFSLFRSSWRPIMNSLSLLGSTLHLVLLTSNVKENLHFIIRFHSSEISWTTMNSALEEQNTVSTNWILSVEWSFKLRKSWGKLLIEREHKMLCVQIHQHDYKFICIIIQFLHPRVIDQNKCMRMELKFDFSSRIHAALYFAFISDAFRWRCCTLACPYDFLSTSSHYVVTGKSSMWKKGHQRLHNCFCSPFVWTMFTEFRSMKLQFPVTLRIHDEFVIKFACLFVELCSIVVLITTLSWTSGY